MSLWRSRHEQGPQDVSNTLYKLKIQHVALSVIPVALLLYAYEEELTAWHRLPYRSVADTLLMTGTVVLVFEWFVRREAEARIRGIVLGAVHRELGPLMERVARSLFTSPETLMRALNDATLATVVRAALKIILKDDTLAAEVDEGLLRAIAKYGDRWTDAELNVVLTRIYDHESPAVRDRYFQAYVSIRFRTTLHRTEFPVWCVSTKEAYDNILWDEDSDFFYAWLQPATRDFPTVSESSFEVDSIVVDGSKLESCVAKNLDDQRMLITCTGEVLEGLQNRSVIVEATLKIKIPKRAHCINLSVPVPTRGVVMAMDYADTDIRRVEVIDMFVSGKRPDIRALPTSSRQRGIAVRLQEWAIPRGGVVFIWHLEQEQSTVFTELLSRPGAF